MKHCHKAARVAGNPIPIPHPSAILSDLDNPASPLPDAGSDEVPSDDSVALLVLVELLAVNDPVFVGATT